MGGDHIAAVDILDSATTRSTGEECKVGCPELDLDDDLNSEMLVARATWVPEWLLSVEGVCLFHFCAFQTNNIHL